MNFIEVKDVVKQYDGHRALDHAHLMLAKVKSTDCLAPTVQERHR